MTTLLNFVAPENIDQVNWDELALQVKMVKAFQREQRETYVGNVENRTFQGAVVPEHKKFALDFCKFLCRNFYFYENCSHPKNERRTNRGFQAAVAHRFSDFEDIVERLPDSAAPAFNSYMELVPRFFECRGFHEYAKLPYHDPRDENGQIIRVALAGVLGAKFDK